MQVRGAFADVVELIPQRARVVLYVGSVGLAVCALAAQRVVGIWWPEYRDQVDSTVAEILPWVLFVIGVLGTAYRPGRGESPGPLQVIEPGHLELAQAQELQSRTIATLVANGWTKEQATLAVKNNGLLGTGDIPGGPAGP